MSCLILVKRDGLTIRFREAYSVIAEILNGSITNGLCEDLKTALT